MKILMGLLFIWTLGMKEIDNMLLHATKGIDERKYLQLDLCHEKQTDNVLFLLQLQQQKKLSIVKTEKLTG